jgi:hypothetical protein
VEKESQGLKVTHFVFVNFELNKKFYRRRRQDAKPEVTKPRRKRIPKSKRNRISKDSGSPEKNEIALTNGDAEMSAHSDGELSDAESVSTASECSLGLDEDDDQLLSASTQVAMPSLFSLSVRRLRTNGPTCWSLESLF